MSRPIFGVTDSPREAARKAKEAARAERLLERDRAYLPEIERDASGVPVRMYFRRNPHFVAKQAPTAPRSSPPTRRGRKWTAAARNRQLTPRVRRVR